MRISVKKRQLDNDDIPTASFSDLAFLLIIFFILTTALTPQTGFVSELPSGQQGETQQTKTPILALHDGRMQFDDQEIQRRELRGRLAGLGLAAKQGQDKIVMLSADGKVSYQEFYEAMVAIHQASGVVAIVREEGKAAP
ncbi:MAG: biopolymer transporter ExbD [Lentisphaerae bacterium]|nr:biopolymer transporter ExbD [Lentisphaerota bacterium]